MKRVLYTWYIFLPQAFIRIRLSGARLPAFFFLSLHADHPIPIPKEARQPRHQFFQDNNKPLLAATRDCDDPSA